MSAESPAPRRAEPQVSATVAAGAPLPSTLAGLLMAGAYAAGLPLAQQMTARRLLTLQPLAGR